MTQGAMHFPKNTIKLQLRFFTAPFRLLECELHTFIHTFAFQKYPLHLGSKPKPAYRPFSL